MLITTEHIRVKLSNYVIIIIITPTYSCWPPLLLPAVSSTISSIYSYLITFSVFPAQTSVESCPSCVSKCIGSNLILKLAWITSIDIIFLIKQIQTIHHLKSIIVSIKWYHPGKFTINSHLPNQEQIRSQIPWDIFKVSKWLITIAPKLTSRRRWPEAKSPSELISLYLLGSMWHLLQ